MAEAKEIMLGLGAIALIAGALSPDPHPPKPPQICDVPQADGSTVKVPILSIPCDKMVQDALTELEKARSIQVPETVKVESYKYDKGDSQIAPIGEISEDENTKFTEPYEKVDGLGEGVEEMESDDNKEEKNEEMELDNIEDNQNDEQQK